MPRGALALLLGVGLKARSFTRKARLVFKPQGVVLSDTKRIVFVVFVAAMAALVVMQVDSVANYLRLVGNACAPVGAGAVFAYLANLLMVRIEPYVFAKSSSSALKRLRRPLSIFITFALIGIAFTAVSALVAFQMKDSLDMLGQGLAKAWSVLESFLASLNIDDKIASVVGQRPDWAGMVSEGFEKLGGSDKLFDSVLGVGDSLTRTLVDFGLGLVLAVYFLMAKERVARGAKTFASTVLPRPWDARAYRACVVADECFSRFISGQLVEAVILGALCTLGMWVLGLPHALTIGLCVGASALIPVFGAWIGGIIGALMILPVSVQKTLVFLVFLLVLQFVENHVIYPRTMGNATGVSSIWVLVAIVVGGSLAGILGVMLAVPCVATAMRLLEPWWRRDSLT